MSPSSHSFDALLKVRGVEAIVQLHTATPLYKQANEWKDGDAMFLNCSVWRQPAENVAETLSRGMRVIVQGRLKQRSYETKDGERRTVYEVDVEEVGPSLLFATAKVTRVASGTEPRPARQPAGRTPPADPWAAQALTDPAPF